MNLNSTLSPSDAQGLLRAISDRDTDRMARTALSMCADAGGDVVVLANTHGVLTTLRAIVAGQALPDGSIPPATALVGRLTNAHLKQTLRTTTAHGMRILTPSDADWPARLIDLGPEQPLALWARGNIELVGGENVAALTGSRNATVYGTQVAADLAVDLAQGDQVLVSGTGFGIDEAVHRAALTVPTPSVAVSSCGLDRPHPAANEGLLEAVLRSGGLVISEHPPGRTPSRTRAVRAGRIIAALAAATIIVEAGVRSGSVGIAHEALRLGRPIGAVPGPLTSQASTGCHRLIQEGETRLITDADDIADMIRSRVASS